ncbi:MAG TPA: hypothetical protein VLA97_01250, partial [Nocardioidaceae bacterium]|nr:hypothetical protein [Nocardioidaceae bacterium]
DEEKMTAALERIRREVEAGWDEDHDGYGGSAEGGSSSSAPAEVYPSYSPPPGTSTESGSTTSESPGVEGPEVGGPATSSLGDEPTAPEPGSTEVPSDGTTSEGVASDPAEPEGESPYAEGHEESHEEDPDADGAVPGGTDSLVPSGGETAEPGTNPQLQPGQVEPYPGQVLPGQFQTLQPGQLETLQPGQLELRTGAPGELQPGMEVRPAEPGTDPGVVTSDPEYLSEEPYEADQGDDDDTGEEFAYAVRGSYVFLGEYQEVLDRAVRSETVLADDPAFASDVDAIGVDDQVAVAWADLGRAYDLMSEADRDDLRSFLGVSDPSGRVVVGTHLEPDYVEVVARSRDVRTSGLTADLAAQPGSELVRGLPSDVDFAFSATGLGDALARMYDRGEGLPLLGMVEDRSEAPVTDPSEALRALFGTEFAAGITIADEDWDLVLRGDTDDPAQAAEVLRPLLDLTGEPDLVVEQLDGGYVASTDQGFAQAAGASSGGLGDDPRFTRAVADPEGAHAVLFLDLARTFAVWDPEDEELAPLSALGISLTGTPEDGVFTLRLTTK